jgi:hypothetical protein
VAQARRTARSEQERAAFRAQRELWAVQTRQFAELVERFSAELQARRERRERRSRLVRRVLTLSLSDR